MKAKYLKSFEIDNIEYIFDLKHFNYGKIHFLIKDDLNNFFEIYHSDEDNLFLCDKVDDVKGVKRIKDNDFILSHIKKFSTLFSNDEIYYQEEDNFIEDNSNKLIVYSKDVMFFYSNKFDALFKVFKYKILDIELIYQENSLEKIDYSEAQKDLNELIKNNYDLLEIKLIKLDISNLENAIQDCDDEELCNELEIDLKKQSDQYLLKLSIARDMRNCNGLHEVFLKNMSYLHVTFNNSLTFKIGKFIGHIFAIQNLFLKSNPSILKLIFSRIANSILLPLNTLFFELSDLLTADFYHEKKFEINNEIDKNSNVLDEFYATSESLCQKNKFNKLIYETVDIFLTYTIDIFCFIIGEIYYFIKLPVNKFKKLIFLI